LPIWYHTLENPDIYKQRFVEQASGSCNPSFSVSQLEAEIDPFTSTCSALQDSEAATLAKTVALLGNCGDWTFFGEETKCPTPIVAENIAAFCLRPETTVPPALPITVSATVECLAALKQSIVDRTGNGLGDCKITSVCSDGSKVLLEDEMDLALTADECGNVTAASPSNTINILGGIIKLLSKSTLVPID
jgi:hypothetical protein